MTIDTTKPWKLEPVAGCSAWVVDANGQWTALACGDNESDAREHGALIAASPLMLGLARRVAALNVRAGEIGAGMLAQLVEDANRALTVFEMEAGAGD